uniref:Uncharacterized protein n=1 Tax=Schistosoma haematobium TaxID=6185 RepID=A0A095A414_SCHHA
MTDEDHPSRDCKTMLIHNKKKLCHDQLSGRHQYLEFNPLIIELTFHNNNGNNNKHGV